MRGIGGVRIGVDRSRGRGGRHYDGFGTRLMGSGRHIGRREFCLNVAEEESEGGLWEVILSI